MDLQIQELSKEVSNAQAKKNKFDEAVLRKKIGVLYLQMKNYTQSLNFLKQANTLLQDPQWQDELIRADVFYHIGCCCLETKDMNEATTSLQQALTRLNSSGIFFVWFLCFDILFD